jgi:transcriptional regulator with XRE-family HTH domain
MSKFTPISVHDLGDYLREQRQSAQLTLRQLSEVAGISNPYISQVERGLKKPSAEILQALAKALRISAESLYVRAGILDERTDRGEAAPLDVTEAILADPKLNDRQRAVLLDVYVSFVGEPAATTAPSASSPQKTRASAQPTKAAQATTAAQATKAAQPKKASRRAPRAAKAPSPSPESTQEQSPSSAQSPSPGLDPTQKSSNKEKK